MENKSILLRLGIIFLLTFAGVGLYQTNEWLTYTEDSAFINSINQSVAVMQNINDDTRMDIYQFNPLCPGNVSKWIITDDESKVKCGNSIMYQWKTYVVYEKFYGEDENVTNTKKKKSISIDLINQTYDCSYNESYNDSNGLNQTRYINKTCTKEDSVKVSKTLEHYKGRQSVIANDFEEEYIATENNVKLNFYLNSYHTSKNIIKMCFSRFDDSIIKFDGIEEYDIKEENGKICYYYGYKKGDLVIDPQWSYDLPQRESNGLFLYPNNVSSNSEYFGGVKGGMDGDFNGVDDKIDIGTLSGVTSVAFWADLTTTSVTEYLFGHGLDSQFSSGYFGIVRSSSTGYSVSYQFYAGGAWQREDTGIYSGLHHFALVLNSSSNEAYFYIDGSLFRTISDLPDGFGSDLSSRIGYNNNNYWYKDIMGNILIYNKVLSSTEISDLYTAGRFVSIDTTDVNLLYSNDLRGTYTDFDGTDDYISTILDIDSNSELSFGGWFYADNLGSFYRMLAIWGEDSSWGTVQLRYEPDGCIHLRIGDGSSETNVVSNSIQTGKWYHVMATVKEAEQVKLYIDGTQTSTSQSFGSFGNPSSNFVLGKNAASNANYWEGKMSNVLIFDKALNSTEVSDLYNEGRNAAIDTTDANLVYYNDMSALTDLSSNGANAQAYNGVIVTNDNSFDFDGTNDYIEIGTPLSGLNVWSMSFWFNADNVNNKYMISNNRDTSVNGELSVYIDSDSKLKTYVRPATAVVGSTTITTGNWYNVILVSDGTVIKSYLNNNLESTLTTSQTINSQIMSLARRTTAYFDGEISNVLIFPNIELNSTEIMELYNNGRTYEYFTIIPEVSGENIQIFII